MVPPIADSVSDPVLVKLSLMHNCTHLTSKVMLKILQARLKQYVNHELPGVQAVFSKTILNIWKFTGHILLKPGLENFEH